MGNIRRSLSWLKFLLLSAVILVMYIVIVVCLLRIHLEEKSPKTEEKYLYASEKTGRVADNKYTTNCLIVTEYSCKVMCYGIVDQDIADIVNKLNFSECDASDIRLQLPNIVFTNANIMQGWLIKVQKKVIHLEISSEHLKTMGKEGFAGHPFTHLKKLEIINSKLSSLTGDMFLNSAIEILAITNEEHFIEEQDFSIHWNALQYLTPTLTTLTFVRTLGNPWAITNLTGPGTCIFEKLTVIDMRDNNILFLYNNSFVSAVKLKTLFLSNNHIQAIEVHAFKTVGKTLTTLTLDNNQLTTFEEGVFEGFVGTGEINVNNNPLECDCNLLWFKEFYEANRVTYFEQPLECKGGIDYTLVDFCPSTTTDSSTTNENISVITTSEETNNTTLSAITTDATTFNNITTIPTSTTAATSEAVFTTPKNISSSIVPSTNSEKPDNNFSSSTALITTSTVVSSTSISTTSKASSLTSTAPYTNLTSLVTTNLPSSAADDDNDMPCKAASQKNFSYRTHNRMFIYEVAVRNNSIILEFYSIEKTPYIELKCHHIDDVVNLIWISTKDQNVHGCISKLYETAELDSLAYGNVYILCLVKPLKKYVDPFDCTSFSVPLTWELTPWMLNKDKLLLIGVMVLINCVIILISCCSAICFVKRNSGRVKNDKTKSLLVQKQQYIVSSASKDDGYVSPIARKLSTISEKECEGSFRRKKSCEGGLYEHLRPPLDNSNVDKSENIHPFASSSSIL